ncbi:MAG TPA: C69 family dipeptidase [bacterium]|nr:C69 family dipeptidase [bacterium]
MRNKFKYFLILLLIFSLARAENFNCFTILAGREATKSGCVLLAHNEDDYGQQVVNFYKVKSQDFTEKDSITLKNGARLLQEVERNAYVWLQIPGLDFSDSYFNDQGVVIASDGCRSREDRSDLTDGGIGYWLRRLMAERANSARQAVKIGGHLVEKYGYYSSGRSYCIADTAEAWIMAVVKGRRWVARRIPDDHVAVIPNFYTIQDINLNDTLNYLASDDIITYAKKRGWYDPEEDGEFNFRQVYGAGLDHPSNVNRMGRGVNLLSEKQYEIDSSTRLPFSFQPRKKLSRQDLMKVLRDHYENTELAASNEDSIHTNKNRPICTRATKYGFVAQLTPKEPLEENSVLWLAPGRSCSMPAIPIYFSIEKFPSELQQFSSPQIALENQYKEFENPYQNNSEHLFVKIIEYCDYYDENYDRLKNSRTGFIKDYEDSLSTVVESLEYKNDQQLLNILNKISTNSIQKLYDFIELTK